MYIFVEHVIHHILSHMAHASMLLNCFHLIELSLVMETLDLYIIAD